MITTLDAMFLDGSQDVFSRPRQIENITRFRVDFMGRRLSPGNNEIRWYTEYESFYDDGTMPEEKLVEKMLTKGQNENGHHYTDISYVGVEVV